MFDAVRRGPGLPARLLVFWGAAAFFLLAMARHLRVFAVARPSRPFANVPARVVGLVEYAFVQTKMFKDPGAAVMHAGHLLGVRAADHRHGQHRDRRDHPGGPVKIPVDGLHLGAHQRDAERRRRASSSFSIGWAYLPPARHRSRGA